MVQFNKEISMSISFSDMKELLRYRGSIIISASDYTTSELKDFARYVNKEYSHIILKNAGEKSFSDLKEILRYGSGKVFLDFTNN